jgi:hypothetical protein
VDDDDENDDLDDAADETKPVDPEGIEARDDCDNPIRGESGLFDGCAPGEKGGSASAGAKASPSAKPAGDKPAAPAKKLTPKQKAAAKAKIAKEKAKAKIAKEKAKKAKERAKVAAVKEKAHAKIKAAKAKIAAQKQKIQAKKAAAALKKAESAKAKMEKSKAKAEASKKKLEGAKKPGKSMAEIVKFAPPPPPSIEALQEEKKAVAESMKFLHEGWDEHVRSFTTHADPQEYGGSPMSGMTLSPMEFNKQRLAYASSLSPKQKDAALYYSGNGYTVLNNSLRNGSFEAEHNEDIREIAGHLDAAIDNHSINKDTYVARGMSGTWTSQFLGAVKEGSVFEEPGYTSTSATEPFDSNDKDGVIKMRIRLPKGAKAAPIPTAYSTENEYLLPRGSRFKVIGIKKSNKGGVPLTEMEVELVQ